MIISKTFIMLIYLVATTITIGVLLLSYALYYFFPKRKEFVGALSVSLALLFTVVFSGGYLYYHFVVSV